MFGMATRTSKKKRASLFKKLLLTYIIITFVPLLAACFQYLKSTAIIEENARESSIQSLKHLVHTFDQRYSEINTAITQISTDVSMNELMNLASPFSKPNNIYSIKDLQGRFANYLVSNSFVDEVFLYCSKGDFLISNRVIALDIERLYYQPVLKLGDMDFKTFHDDILRGNGSKSLYKQDIYLNNYKKQVCLIIESVKNKDGYITENKLLFVIDNRKFRESIETMRPDGNIFIFDSRMELVYGSGELPQEIEISMLHNENGAFELNTDAGRYMISFVRSAYNNYHYVSVTDYNMLMHNVVYIKQLVIIMALISLIGASVLSVIFAYQNIRPIHEVEKWVYGLKSPGEANLKIGKTNLSIIREFAESMVNENTELSQKIGKYNELLATNLFSNLINNPGSSYTDVKGTLEQWGIPLPSGDYFVLMCEIINGGFENAQQLSTYKMVISNAVEKSMRTITALDISVTRTAFFVNGADNEDLLKEKLDVFALFLASRVKDELGAEIRFSVGWPPCNINDIRKSYLEALQSMEYNEENTLISWGNTVIGDEGHLFFNADIKMQLIKAVTQGSIGKLNTVLDCIYHQNMAIPHLPHQKQKWLLYKLNSVMMEICSETGNMTMDMIERIEKGFYISSVKMDFDSAYEEMKSAFIHLANTISISREDRSIALRKAIVDYIKENFHDPNLFLPMVAAHYKLSESTVSSFIKDETKLSFAAFLEKLRMDYACELLSQGNIPVETISVKAGYNSSRTFRRAFKKYTGHTPTDYSTNDKEV